MFADLSGPCRSQGGIIMKRHLLAAAFAATAVHLRARDGHRDHRGRSSQHDGQRLFRSQRALDLWIGTLHTGRSLSPIWATAFTTAVLTIGTPETSVNLFEDTTPRQVSVDFAFLNPLDATGASRDRLHDRLCIDSRSPAAAFWRADAAQWTGPTLRPFSISDTGGIVLAAPPGRDIRNAGKCARERHLHLCEPIGSGTRAPGR